jgi:hypothetical protein
VFRGLAELLRCLSPRKIGSLSIPGERANTDFQKGEREMTTTKKLKVQGLTGGPQLTIWEGGAAYPAEAAWDATTASTTEILGKLLGPSSERVCESLTGTYPDLRGLAVR